MQRSSYLLTEALENLKDFLPDLLAGLLTLVVGFLVALVISAITRALLHRIGFDRLLFRMGLVKTASTAQGSQWAASIAFWTIILISAMQAARTLGMPLVAAGLATVIAYVPHVLGALAILGAALLVGNWVRDRIAGDTGEPSAQRNLVAGSVRAGILALGTFMALTELRIAKDIVTTAFTFTLGSIALAAALAFGLGSRSVAERMAEQWYARRQRQPEERV